MNVAVVAASVREAVAVAARLGMTRSSTPLAQGKSPLLGHRFTAVLRVEPEPVGEEDAEWFERLRAKTTGPWLGLVPLSGLSTVEKEQ